MTFHEDIQARARSNAFFREVVATGPHAQVVVMSIPPGDEIGEEVHEDTDQVLVFVDGHGAAVIEGERSPVSPGHLVHVFAGKVESFAPVSSAPPFEEYSVTLLLIENKLAADEVWTLSRVPSTGLVLLSRIVRPLVLPVLLTMSSAPPALWRVLS